MQEFHRIFIAAVTMVLLGAASIWATVIAQDVFDSAQPVDPPTQSDTEAIGKLSQALQDGSEFKPTGDPVYDEVLELIEQQGSVLEGSSLDPKAQEPKTRPSTRESLEKSNKARTAERLLKAARFLEQVEPLDDKRRDLVNQMRRETVRLLSE